jgi:hypothetical protein
MPKTKTTQPKLFQDNGKDKHNTKASLSSLIKSARDIMRKDAWLNGDLDRLPHLSWILFLKCYDDLDVLKAKVKTLRELQVKGGKELSVLMPSILDKAFKGEL